MSQEQDDLPELVLSDNVNDYDKGSDTSESKLGEKSLQKQILELKAEIASLKSKEQPKQSRLEYVQERQKKMAAGDRQAINEFMVEQTAINEAVKARQTRSRIEYDQKQEDKTIITKEQRLANLSKEDKEALENDIKKLERRKQREIENVYKYFASQGKEWEDYLNDIHTAEESPAHDLIVKSDNGKGWCSTLHRYQRVIESPSNDRTLVASTFTIGPVERHFKNHNPEEHKERIIEIIESRYNQQIEAVKDNAAIDPEIKLKQDIRQIQSIKTRPGGDITTSRIKDWNRATSMKLPSYRKEEQEED